MTSSLAGRRVQPPATEPPRPWLPEIILAVVILAILWALG